MNEHKPKVKCLVCRKECGGDYEDAYLHVLKTGHNQFELLMDNEEETGEEKDGTK